MDSKSLDIQSHSPLIIYPIAVVGNWSAHIYNKWYNGGIQYSEMQWELFVLPNDTKCRVLGLNPQPMRLWGALPIEPPLQPRRPFPVLIYTGTGTKFGAYLSPSPTIFKHEMNIYWPIMKNKLTNKEYSLHST